MKKEEFKVGDRVVMKPGTYYDGLDGAKGVIVKQQYSIYLEFLPDDENLWESKDDPSWPVTADEIEHLPEGE